MPKKKESNIVLEYFQVSTIQILSTVTKLMDHREKFLLKN